MIRPPGDLDDTKHPGALELAANGQLPRWAIVKPARRAHIERVAALMDEWAVNLDLPPHERARWRAAAWLHDALRDADPRQLRQVVGSSFDSLPDALLHGPASATLLEQEGVTDTALLLAIGYHTIGHPEFDSAGRALYLADYLEPGRDFDVEQRGRLRLRMPDHMDAIIVEVAAARIAHLLEDRRPIRPETAIFWNRIVEL